MIKNIVDHLGRKVEYQFPPKRIISLCPGITETLYTLGLEENIVGRTRYCIFPKDKVEQATIVGGIKEIQLNKIHELKPDLIIVEREENTPEIVAQLEEHYPVFVAEVQTIQGAYRMIDDIGALTNRKENAEKLIAEIKAEFQTIPKTEGKRVSYVIWRKPYMVVGKDTYINSLLEEMGLINPFTAFEGRYPSVTNEEFQGAELDYLFLASEPFPFKEKHKAEFQKNMPHVNPIILDGEMFWYGARMLEAAKYFREILSQTEPFK